MAQKVGSADGPDAVSQKEQQLTPLNNVVNVGMMFVDKMKQIILSAALTRPTVQQNTPCSNPKTSGEPSDEENTEAGKVSKAEIQAIHGQGKLKNKVIEEKR
jgi:hypothetical protein